MALGVPTVWFGLSGFSMKYPGWFPSWGLSRDGMENLEIWQFFTHWLVHGGWLHLGCNLLVLLLIGARIERYAGGKFLTLVIVAGWIFGGGFHLAFHDGILAGASGSGFALMVALGVISPESRIAPLGVSAANLGKGILLAEGLLMLADPGSGVPGFSEIGRWVEGTKAAAIFNLAHACHFGGALSGWIAGRWLLRPRVSLETLRQQRAKRDKETKAVDQNRCPRR